MSSSSPATIYELFGVVKREIGPVGKDSTNAKQGYAYRGVDAVVNAAAEALDRHGVITIPILESKDYATVEVGNNRSRMAHVQVTVTYRFAGPAGDSFDAKVPGEAMDSGDKATPKAMSVAYRTALLQTLNLPTGDPDPDSESYERSSARPDQARAAWEDAATIDADAQHLAELALACTTLDELAAVTGRARHDRKMGATVKNPDSGGTGKLSALLDWRRRNLTAADQVQTQTVPEGKE